MESGTTLPRDERVRYDWRAHAIALWRIAVTQHTLLLVGSITVGGGLLRLAALDSKSLWIDETFTIGMATQSWPSFVNTVAHVQPNMECFYLIMRVLVSLLPSTWLQGETLWRLVPALAGTATVPLVFLLARRIFDLPTAMLATLLVATNEFLVEYSQQARGYTLFVLLLTGSYLALVRWLEGESRALAAFSVLATLAFLTQAFEMVFLAGQIATLALLYLRGQTVRWRALALALAPLGLVVAWRLPIYLAHPDQVAWIPRPSKSDLIHGLRQLAGGDGGSIDQAGDFLLIALTLAIVVLVLAALRSAPPWHIARQSASPPLDRAAGYILVLCWLGVPVLGTWLGSQVKPMWVTRYLAPASVAACLILAAGVRAVARLAASPATQRAIFMIAAISLLALASLPLHDYYARAGWEDWRGAASYLQNHFTTGDGVVCYDNQWGCNFGFSHYLSGAVALDPQAPGAFSWQTYAQKDREASFAQAVNPQALAPYLAQHRRVWVLLGHYTNGQGDWRGGLHWLDANATQSARQIFTGDIEVYLYTYTQK